MISKIGILSVIIGLIGMSIFIYKLDRLDDHEMIELFSESAELLKGVDNKQDMQGSPHNSEMIKQMEMKLNEIKKRSMFITRIEYCLLAVWLGLFFAIGYGRRNGERMKKDV